VRAVRNGSVRVDLASAHDLAPEWVAEDWSGSLTWPDPDEWVAAVTSSELVRSGVLHVWESHVYLDRYWREEEQVVADLGARATRPGETDAAVLTAALEAYFPAGAGLDFADQRRAAETACAHPTSVITGGPGTGKTTTVARLLGVLTTLAADRPLRIALAAPTGKAAARMAQAVREATSYPDFPGHGQTEGAAALRRARIESLDASTLHRLLGWRPDSSTRFRHDRSNPLPFDVVVIDETSMVSLTLMARLLEAMRPSARLVLVGDADQLASVEAGAVLGDLVKGWEGTGPVAQLGRTRRFGRNIGMLAGAIQEGHVDEVIDMLRTGLEPVHEGDGRAGLADPDAVDALLRPRLAALRDAAAAGDHAGALRIFGEHRLLCAHRDGPYGVSTWNRRAERMLLTDAGDTWLPQWYAGRPVIVDRNDRGLQLWNGDTGVVSVSPEHGRLVAVIDDGSREGRALPTSRLADVTTAHAMTVHRSQGSQFDEVTVLLPDAGSRILTRELLYTAVTRAKSVVRVVGSDDAIRAAVSRRAQRATGLARRLGEW
jgi:exodeoxyribonuclease V alpha subunit